MIIMLAASAITLTALQASINAPREAFRSCLKDASSKAANEKVAGDAYEAYVRNACSGELGSFQSATVKFDVGNKMSKKDASADADAMISDFVASARDHYDYIMRASEPAKQEASAPAVAAPAVTPPPTPASEPK